jgi:two-component system CheB/CheR fusion protein
MAKKNDRNNNSVTHDTPKATRKKNKNSTPPTTEQLDLPEPSAVRVVAMGASAGGLEAFELFFRNMPVDSGLAFVVIQHLDPTHKSILNEIIGRYTTMKVTEVTEGVDIEKNQVYIIPPNRDLVILNGRLHTIEPSTRRGFRQPVDFFFRNLALEFKERAIGIVLSGTGSEGGLGSRAIKGEGGMIMVQAPETAKYDGMPRNAIATGLADFILPPERMPEQLIAYIRHSPSSSRSRDQISREEDDALDKILVLVRLRTGHDFSYYKRNTIARRVDRRMAVHQKSSIEDYLEFLQDNPSEIQILFKELLINVTNFFRNPEAFDALKKIVLPKFFATEYQDVRVWVPACSSGEEAYSLAMLVKDYADEIGRSTNIHLFATDIDEEAIEIARCGVYPASIAADVPPELLEKFFTLEDTQFRIKREIRDMVVFALQNAISDPPFSKLDMVACRNLLIYMNTDLQKKLFRLFHYALKPGGYMFLGSSESIGASSDLFAAVDRRSKIYVRKEYDNGNVLNVYGSHVPDFAVTTRESTHKKIIFREVAESALLENFSASGALVDDKDNVVYFYGSASNYLRPAAGEASLNVLKMVRDELRFQLANSIRTAQMEKRTVYKPNLKLKEDSAGLVDLIVRPVSPNNLLLVLFQETSGIPQLQDDQSFESEAQSTEGLTRVQQLEQELSSAKEYLQTTIEELETANEELKSMNEELQSANEELQSTNEELETSKEEQQSVNEELITVNSELQQRIEELSKVNDDMNNLLASTHLGTIFLDVDLNIERFTPDATELINLIPSDVGRPIGHIVTNLTYDHLMEDCREVLKTLVPKEIEVITKDHKWYLMRLRPYTTREQVMQGVVLTFVEITAQKVMQKQVADGALFENILNTTHECFMLLNTDLRVQLANDAFYRTFSLKPKNTINRLIYDVGDKQFATPPIKKLLEQIIPKETRVENYQVTFKMKRRGIRTMLFNATELVEKETGVRIILLAIQDITDIKIAENC